MANNWLIRWISRWWFWSDEGAPSTEIVRRWRRVIFAVALLMPLFSIGGFALMARHSQFSVSDLLALLLLYLWSVLFNWPFFVFGRIITRRFQAKWPVLRDTQWASAGGLVGLSLPYAVGYYQMPFELTSGASDAGQGFGIYLPAIAPILGSLLGSVGWFLGLGAAKVLALLKS